MNIYFQDSNNSIFKRGCTASCDKQYDRCIEDMQISYATNQSGVFAALVTFLGYTAVVGPPAWGAAGAGFFFGSMAAGFNAIGDTTICSYK